jgi:hypothetical protein
MICMPVGVYSHTDACMLLALLFSILCQILKWTQNLAPQKHILLIIVLKLDATNFLKFYTLNYFLHSPSYCLLFQTWWRPRLSIPIFMSSCNQFVVPTSGCSRILERTNPQYLQVSWICLNTSSSKTFGWQDYCGVRWRARFHWTTTPAVFYPWWAIKLVPSSTSPLCLYPLSGT